MQRRLWLSGVPAAILVWVALPASAQTVIGAKSGVINWVEGSAFLNDQPYVMQPSQFGEVKENMVFRTEAGRAEVLLPPGVFFRMAENSSFKMISNRLIDTRVELLTGSGIVEIDDLAKEANVTVVSKDATVTLNKAGLYRFDSQPSQLKVFKGTADVALKGDTVSVPAGKMMTLTGAVASVEKFNVEDTDSFDHWSRRRGSVLADANISAAKQAGGYSNGGSGLGGAVLYGGVNPCYGGGPGYGGPGYGGVGGYGPYAQPWGTWGYNPYYGMGTYVPCQGASYMSPYGYYFWSPMGAYRAFFSPNPMYTFPTTRNGSGGPLAGYTAPGRRGFGGSTPMAPAPAGGGLSNGGAVSRGGSGTGSSVGGVAGHGGGGGGGRH